MVLVKPSFNNPVASFDPIVDSHGKKRFLDDLENIFWSSPIWFNLDGPSNFSLQDKLFYSYIVVCKTLCKPAYIQKTSHPSLQSLFSHDILPFYILFPLFSLYFLQTNFSHTDAAENIWKEAYQNNFRVFLITTLTNIFYKWDCSVIKDELTYTHKLLHSDIYSINWLQQIKVHGEKSLPTCTAIFLSFGYKSFNW